MNNYNNNNKFGKPHGERFESRNSGRSRFGSQNSGQTQMHDTICADCGNNCKVPFIPSSGKPVYCSNCFEKRGNGDNNSERPRSSQRSNFAEKRNFSDKKSFAPRTDRPTENFSKQFEILNSKLDKILNALTEKEKTISAKKTEKKTKVKTLKVATTEPETQAVD